MKKTLQEKHTELLNKFKEKSIKDWVYKYGIKVGDEFLVEFSDKMGKGFKKAKLTGLESYITFKRDNTVDTELSVYYKLSDTARSCERCIGKRKFKKI